MRMQRAAGVVAAVGLGLFAVGCGGTADSGKGAPKLDSGKITQASSKVTEGVSKAGDLVDKAKAAAEDVNKQLDPLKKAFETLTAKVKEAEKEAVAAKGDATKETKLNELDGLKDKAAAVMKQITDQLGGLAGVKDAAAFETAKKGIMELVAKLKELLKDYLPK